MFCNYLQTPWLEYMDYTKVREDQQAAAQEWETTHFRIEDQRLKVPVTTSPEDASEPHERILKRLVQFIFLFTVSTYYLLNVLKRRRECGIYLATARRHRRRLKMQKRDE